MTLPTNASAISRNRILFFSFLAFFLAPAALQAQVNAVEFGKNRVQYKKFKWSYYQTKNFNVYYSQGGEELAKFVAQSAEKELPQIETAAEYSLQRRANVVVYNNYADFQQSNIGLGFDWQNTSGQTKLVNNKMVVYFDADHAKLRTQIRTGIARVLTDNVLFGDDLGEFASNQALLDLPKWLTDGYAAYLAENWSTDLDDELKSEILSGDYKNFNRFVFAKPEIAGHAFWYFIEEKYKKENVTFLLYLARIYKNLNKASMQICKKKFKDVLAEFMEYQDEKYYKDISKRKPYPKGSYIEGFDINKKKDYFRFNVNPQKRSRSYVVTQYRNGIVRVIYNDEDVNKTLLKIGTRSQMNEINPNYPIVAWDPKGTRIAVIYTEEGKIKMFVYDIVTKIKYFKLDLTQYFDLVQDFNYMYNSNMLLVSAVKNGHTDIYTFDLQKEKARQVTNDVYDDRDPSFVTFPNKTGIIFASNRPNSTSRGGDTSLPSDNHYNIFLVTDFGDKPELNQVTQLSHLKYGDARMPSQYNVNHFTFVSDENGIGNRYAGFFTTKKEGLDTLVLIGTDILRNPSTKEVDSALRVNKKTDVDSVAVVSVSSDSAYTFPITNYESRLYETRTAGDNDQVSEVTRQSDEKVLYKLKINEDALRRRNITAQPTEYMKKKMSEYNAKGVLKPEIAADTAKKEDDFFQSEYANEKKENKAAGKVTPGIEESDNESVLKSMKHFPYKPPKFYVENGAFGFNNSVLINRYEPYLGRDQSGPVQLNGSTPLNGLTRIGTSELMEDLKITGAYKISTNLKNNEWYLNFQNLRKRVDWGFSYYRNSQSMYGEYFDTSGNLRFASIKLFTNMYQGNISYPFDVHRSIRFTTGIRSDKTVIGATDKDYTLPAKDDKTLYSVSRLEYVYDNSLNPAMNIWTGLRYKVYFDWNMQINKVLYADGPNTFNLGFDARYYYPIFQNFIWAGRAAGDFSWGNQKILYFLGGVDGWLMFGPNIKPKDGSDRYYITAESNKPAADQSYAFQSLAVNLRGFKQNIANGNNAVVFNSEFRLPVFSTLLKRTINNAFLRNFQLVQFADLGTAWNGQYNKLSRPTISYGNLNQNNPVQVSVKAGGIGPFAGGYGFGARSMLLGYFLKFDAAWQMNGFFKGKPQLYFAMGLDF